MAAAEGLTASEAAARLSRDGPNALPDPARRTPWRIDVGTAMCTPVAGRLFAFGRTQPFDVTVGLGAALPGFGLLEALQHLRVWSERRRPARVGPPGRAASPA